MYSLYDIMQWIVTGYDYIWICIFMYGMSALLLLCWEVLKRRKREGVKLKCTVWAMWCSCYSGFIEILSISSSIGWWLDEGERIDEWGRCCKLSIFNGNRLGWKVFHDGKLNELMLWLKVIRLITVPTFSANMLLE
jgi:hypothetical protein